MQSAPIRARGRLRAHADRVRHARPVAPHERERVARPLRQQHGDETLRPGDRLAVDGRDGARRNRDRCGRQASRQRFERLPLRSASRSGRARSEERGRDRRAAWRSSARYRSARDRERIADGIAYGRGHAARGRRSSSSSGPPCRRRGRCRAGRAAARRVPGDTPASNSISPCKLSLPPVSSFAGDP